jgi:aspartyl-tRNA(Asn)/glutamyl-tRNA(Gln) amidotransferase subunit A
MIPEAIELVDGYRSKTLSPVDVTQAALDAIDAYDAHVNAFVLVDHEGALAAAKASEARWHSGEPLGPGDGVPTSIKDALWTRGWPTLRGSALIDAAGPWDEDAPCVARLRETGAVLLGKTTTPEYSWKGVTDSLRHGVTGNPWDPTKTSGGSSGGSASAVGLGMGPWSVGTDGGGSVRIPAAFTGTVALKPTYGLIPLYPPSPFGTLSHVGPMTRSVRDTAALLDVICGFDARDWSAMPTLATSFLHGIDSGVAGLRIGFSPDLGFVRNDPEVAAAVRAAVDVLAGLGAVVDEVDPGFADPVEAFHVLWFSGEAKVLQAYGDIREAWADRVDAGLRRTAAIGVTYSASDYLNATAVRMELGSLMGRFHQTYDVLVTPTLPLAAFPVGRDVPDGWSSSDWTSWTPYTYPFNLTQQPALSVPCGFTSAGLPIALQIVGARHADALVLRVGRAYESATDWHRRLPELLAEEAR